MIRSTNEAISRPWILAIALFSLALIAGACSKEPEVASKPESPKKFDPFALELSEPALLAGRETWSKTCQTCHLTGLTGAPIIGDKNA